MNGPVLNGWLAAYWQAAPTHCACAALQSARVSVVWSCDASDGLCLCMLCILRRGTFIYVSPADTTGQRWLTYFMVASWWEHTVLCSSGPWAVARICMRDMQQRRLCASAYKACGSSCSVLQHGEHAAAQHGMLCTLAGSCQLGVVRSTAWRISMEALLVLPVAAAVGAADAQVFAARLLARRWFVMRRVPVLGC